MSRHERPSVIRHVMTVQLSPGVVQRIVFRITDYSVDVTAPMESIEMMSVMPDVTMRLRQTNIRITGVVESHDIEVGRKRCKQKRKR